MSKEIVLKKMSKSVSEIAVLSTKLCLEFRKETEDDECGKELVETVARGVFDMVDVGRRHDKEFDIQFLKEAGCSVEAMEAELSEIIEGMNKD